MASNPNTPDNKSRKTKSTTSSTSASARSVRVALERNNIYIDDTAAESRGAELIETAKAIVNGKRESALKNEKGLELRDTAKKYANTNEMTFIVNVWTKFLGAEDTRLVKRTADGELEDEEEAIRWIETAWEKDHLRCNWNADFTQGSIPPLRNLDPAMKLYCDKAPRVKNPKPDLTYGLLQTAFSEDEQVINDTHKAGLSVGMVHPFFVVEAKLDRSFDEVENQCARGGAAMVRLKRKFNSLAEGTYEDEEARHAGDGDDLGGQTTFNQKKIPIDHYRTDTKSFAFSLALIPRSATMYVHWAEEVFPKEGPFLTVYWHATPIADYTLRNPEAWIALHHDIDNVLDWGVLSRSQELRELCRQIFEREQEEKNKKKQKI